MQTWNVKVVRSKHPVFAVAPPDEGTNQPGFVADANFAFTTGTLAHGQLATFTRSTGSFGTHADYNPSNYTWNSRNHLMGMAIDFEDGLLTKKGLLFDPADAAGFPIEDNWTIETASPPTNLTKYARRFCGAAEQGPLTWFPSVGGAGTLLYVTFKYKIRLPRRSGKLFRAWGQDLNSVYISTGTEDTASPNYDIRGAPNQTEPSGTQWDSPNSLSDNVWVRLELLFDGGTDYVSAWLDGQFQWTNQWMTTWNIETNHTIDLGHMVDSETRYTTDPTGGTTGEEYFADVFYDHTVARFEIADNATWASRTHSEIQVPVTWATGQVQLALNQGEFTTLIGKHLFYLDTANAATHIGAFTNQFTPDAGITVSGIFADGQSFTINKGAGGFGTKPNGAKPLYYFDFGAGDTATNALSRTSAPAPVNGASQTGAPVLTGSTHSWKVDPFDFSGDVYYGTTGTHYPYLGEASRDLYVFKKLKTEKDGADFMALRSDWNIKDFRAWRGQATGHSSEFLGAMGQSSDPTGDWRCTVELTNDGPGGPSWSLLWTDASDYLGLDKVNWKVREVEFRQSSADNALDGEVWQYNKGKVRTEADFCTRTTSQSGCYRYFFWDQPQYSTSGFGYWAYDIVVVDDSFARVLITNQATWDDTVEHEVEYCPATAWADGSITCTVRQGALSTLTGKYLWVIKSDRSHVRVGLGAAT